MLSSYWVRRRGTYAVSAIDSFSGALVNTHLGIVHDLEADAGRLGFARLRLGVDQREIAQMDRRGLGVDARVLRRRLLGVAADKIDALHQRPRLVRDNLQHFAGLALVLASEDQDPVALLDLGGHHSTSGPSEMIFMWFLLLSSRGTGPKMRLPMGSA